MIDYIEFLLQEHRFLPAEMNIMRGLFIKSSGDIDVIVNMIKETDLRSYIVAIIDYPPGASKASDSELDIISVARVIASNLGMIEHKHLRQICSYHFSPLWRIAAFACDYILRADTLYRGRS